MIHESKLRKEVECPQNSAKVFEVNSLCELYQGDDFRRAALKLVTSFLDHGWKVVSKIHFSTALPDWSVVTDFVHACRELIRKPKQLAVILSGPFADCKDIELEEMFRLGMQLEFVAGWWKGSTAEEWCKLNHAAVKRIAEFGYRLPVIWYVHNDNIVELESLIQSSLRANYESGIALPLVCSNPYYDFGPANPTIPDAGDYAALLVRAHTSYRHCDDILSPISELTRRVRYGGWLSDLGLPSPIKLLISSQANISVYRQIPALSTPWLGPQDVLSFESSELTANLISFCRKKLAWSHNPFCGSCAWRYVCGGIDADKVRLDEGKGVLECACYHRMLFLQYLTFVQSLSCDEASNMTPATK